jgi:hypothetical protein
MKIRILPMAAVTFAFLGAACGDGGGDAAYKDIGLEGGEVRARDTVLSVPEGAVDRTVGLNIAPAPADQLPEGVVGPAIDLGPADIQFNAPVTIQLRYDTDRLEDATRPDLVWAGTVVDGEWEPLEDMAVDEATRTVRGTTRRGGRYGPVYGCGLGRRCPVALQFVTRPMLVEAGDCSPAIELQTVSYAGRVVPVVHDTALAISSDFQNLYVYADAGCSEQVSMLRIPAGRSGASFHVRGRVSRAINITAQARDLRPDTYTMSIGPALATYFDFFTGPQRVLSGACSGENLLAFVDQYGNRAPLPNPARVIFSATSRATITFYSDPRCQNATGGIPMAAGDASMSFWFSAELPAGAQEAEIVTVTATVGAYERAFTATQDEAIYP